MCGIAGFWEDPGRSDAELTASAQVMAESMTRRGPDAQIGWADARAGIGLAHARLSVIDLSDAGLQPMTSASGRFVMVYNGEVYNAPEIRSELCTELGAESPDFRGHSDTEVILEACAHWGLEATLARLIGMFAIALWDREARVLSLARDRLGIKPLYWGQIGQLFLFGSELTALRAHKGWHGEINPDALSSYLRFSYVPAPDSIYKGVQKLEAGQILTLKEGEAPQIHSYWSLRAVAKAGLADPLRGDDRELTDRVHDLLMDAVGRRMVADVPLGAFLSGGIDSSCVVALMQAQSDRPVQTFSIGMAEAGYNEAEQAKEIARHLGTDHSELYISAKDAQDVIPDLADYYVEPFANSSQIPTFLVSKLARGSVTVSLSGDGGDELFNGYNRYLWGDRINRRCKSLPLPLRSAAARLIRGLSPERWDAFSRRLPAALRVPQLGQKAHKVSSVLDLPDEEALFRGLVSAWHAPDRLVNGAAEPQRLLWDQTLAQDVPPFMERMQVMDSLTYLTDDNLTKLDRASMAVSLEARVPLLDHRVAELAFHLPRSLRVRDGQGKWVLRQILARYLPREMFERPKMGFGIPIGQWLKGPLRDWAEELLSTSALEADGLLRAAPIRQAWADHLAGRSNDGVPLWTVLMYQAWRQRWTRS
ncbi:asparagine synthase (glutamine-hydrolyzing) [Denitrobaculum tricleocarpae]|uniref:asparagine synthase (glutamine-hydrolyzing) n=1 Tax=Denitrobaculum tricleocarpae TaxID=2591009 RepID=A0A545U2E3_9PROT|nr:asparagine synthase (glutamine-hydrolyzing) [Denitrobaculum tricleocarpae]TQV83641.1 asparagine synthase (glutamine-hydrolyzing) [Denitrobaculum tricleocarpae]